MIICIDVIGGVKFPGINLFNRDSVVAMICSTELAMCEESLKRFLSSYWIIKGDSMFRIDNPGDISQVINFVLDLRSLDWNSLLLILGTLEGCYRGAVSSLGFKWELVLTGLNHTVFIGYNKARNKNCLPVNVEPCVRSTTEAQDYLSQIRLVR